MNAHIKNFLTSTALTFVTLAVLSPSLHAAANGKDPLKKPAGQAEKKDAPANKSGEKVVAGPKKAAVAPPDPSTLTVAERRERALEAAAAAAQTKPSAGFQPIPRERPPSATAAPGGAVPVVAPGAADAGGSLPSAAPAKKNAWANSALVSKLNGVMGQQMPGGPPPTKQKSTSTAPGDDASTATAIASSASPSLSASQLNAPDAHASSAATPVNGSAAPTVEADADGNPVWMGKMRAMPARATRKRPTQPGKEEVQKTLAAAAAPSGAPMDFGFEASGTPATPSTSTLPEGSSAAVASATATATVFSEPSVGTASPVAHTATASPEPVVTTATATHSATATASPESSAATGTPAPVAHHAAPAAPSPSVEVPPITAAAAAVVAAPDPAPSCPEAGEMDFAGFCKHRWGKISADTLAQELFKGSPHTARIEGALRVAKPTSYGANVLTALDTLRSSAVAPQHEDAAAAAVEPLHAAASAHTDPDDMNP